MRFKPVLVVWRDAVDHGDCHGEPIHKPAIQHMVGWLIKKNKKGISVAYEVNEEDGSRRNEVFIESVLIESIKDLHLDE